ncbi:cytochrome P450 [Streptomyces sp. VNUA116]|uniref:cytochrome P450 n=1 Tax=Streptomyces sp. VNUA116 TaxID=3062449 RepID=UPI002677417E|nr:cytochrome P450 [Streptomyces sp. VNUA116]WKU48275.1 cytochrome P450 [Streptomyces sp. VNUA116]
MKTAASIPPAPHSLPLLGHVLPLVRDPLAFLSSLPAHGDLVRIRMGPHSVVMVCDPALTRQVLLNDHVFDKGGPMYDRVREVVSDGLISCPHSRHRRQRRLCQPSFHPDRLSSYATVFVDAAEAVARSWRHGQVIDVATEMTKLATRVAVETMFTSALPPGAARQATADITTVVNGAFRRMITPPFLNRLPSAGNQQYHRAHSRLQHTARCVSTRRRAEGTDHRDLLSSLQNTTDPDSLAGDRALTDAELTDQVLTFFLAGAETTANALAWSLYLLARHPEVEERLCAETAGALGGAPPAFADLPALRTARNVFHETLRLYPPAWLLTRTVTRDTELGGVPLPAGSVIAFSPYLIHRRPDLYADAGRFDPGRWDGPQPDRAAYLPFGAGARQCIGARFAVAEATLALTTITARWRLLPLTGRPLRPSAKVTLGPRGLRMCVMDRRI